MYFSFNSDYDLRHNFLLGFVVVDICGFINILWILVFNDFVFELIDQLTGTYIFEPNIFDIYCIYYKSPYFLNVSILHTVFYA